MTISTQDILNFLATVGLTTTAIISILGYFGKNIFQHYLDKDIEKFKLSLQNEVNLAQLKRDKEIENYKTDLNVILNKQIALQNKKAEVIEKLYGLLAEFNKCMVELTAEVKIIKGQTIEEKQENEIKEIDEAAKKGNAFLDYFRLKKIYFDKDTCLLIDGLNREFKMAYSGYLTSKPSYRFDKDAFETINNKVPPLLTNLEIEFRKMLGVL
jgi:hypothetical protein